MIGGITMKNFHIITILVITFSLQVLIVGANEKSNNQIDFNLFDEQVSSEYSDNLVSKRVHDRLNNILLNQRASITGSLEEPMLFPYQQEYVEYLEAFPIVLDDGKLMMVWGEWNNLYFSSSGDSGLTWTEPELFPSDNENEACISITGLCTQSGRIITIWQSNDQGLKMVYSDNNGISWSEQMTITNDGNDRYTILTQSLDSTLWLCYCRWDQSTKWDIYYRTSADNGMNWSAEQTLVASDNPEIYGTVVSGVESKLLAFYSDRTSGYWDIYQKTSTDSGASWSEPVPVLNSEVDEVMPRVLRAVDGVLWLVYYKKLPAPVLSDAEQYDIHYMQSYNDGDSWTAPERFTHYVGYDGRHNAVLFDNRPFISFFSERWASDIGQRQIWYGIIGTTQDNNPPPAVFNHAIADTIDESVIDIHAFVDDETGISDVKLFYSLNDVMGDPVQMYDDGLHGDWDANDNVWAGQIGPFEIGDQVYYGFSVTDIDANTVDVSCGEFRKNLIHDIGNILLNFWTDSKLADEAEGANACWPGENGQDYLFMGGLWVGTDCLGEPRVMKKHFGESDWRRVPDTPCTLQPGNSDQDGCVIYNDDQSQSGSIGLKVKQESFQWAGASRDDFIIFKYNIYNKGDSGDLSEVFTSLWLDPDVSSQTFADDDLGGYDSERGLLYMYDINHNPNGYIGVKMLGLEYIPHTANIYVHPGPGDDNERFQTMTAGIVSPPTTEADYRMILTAQPFSLDDYETVSVAFGLVMGADLDELKIHADTMDAIFNSEIVGIEEFAINKIPKEFSLAQNYPNPFNPVTIIQYQVSSISNVDLSIYNILGQNVATLVSEKQPAGYYKVEWDASGFGSGIYYYRLLTDKNFASTKKLILLK
jgi:hypothetical protein